MATRKTSKKKVTKKPQKRPSPEKLSNKPQDPITRLDLRNISKRANRKGFNLAGSLKDATLERSLEGASTLTLSVHDPDYVLINSGIFDVDRNRRLDPLEIKLDGLTWRLVKVNPQWGATGNEVELTFEPRVVNVLRYKTGFRSASRAKLTRAQFIESLVKEVKAYTIPFVCAEKNIKQPIEPVEKKKS